MKTKFILMSTAALFTALNSFSQVNVIYGTGAGAGITTGVENTFLGNESGHQTNSGSHNTATGDSSLYTNTTGLYNSAFGDNALFANTSGYSNTGFGFNVLRSNNTGIDNCGFGHYASVLNTTGSYNTALGSYASASNLTGNYNTALGYTALNKNTASFNSGISFEALMNNTTGASNTGAGFQALYANTTGSNNVAVGYTAGNANITGTGNTFVGYNANPSGSNYTNCGAFGNGAVATANNVIYMGNATNLLYCALGVWSGSDSRFKTNVKENVKGLEFIKKLRPVTYNFNTEKLEDHMLQNMPDSVKSKYKEGLDFKSSTSVVRSGFIAQEVEKASEETGYSNSIVHKPSNSTDYYAISYQEIVVPLVKAMQEQQNMIDSLKEQLAQLSKLVKAQADAPKTGSIDNSQSVQLGNADVVVLKQNVPNPFSEQTVISYSIPQSAGTAQLLFYDQSGTLIKTAEIKTKGRGQITVFASDLSSGFYSYTLLVDGKPVDTKKMVKQ